MTAQFKTKMETLGSATRGNDDRGIAPGKATVLWIDGVNAVGAQLRFFGSSADIAEVVSAVPG